MLAGLIKERVNREYEAMFETGVDEMSWDDTENYRMGGSFEWPCLSDVVEYRRQVREIVRSVIRDTELTLPVTHDDAWWAVWMSIEHQRIHLETSSVLIRQLPVSMVTKPVGWKYGPTSTGEAVLNNPMIKQDGGEVRLGKDEDSPCWGWDNEYGYSLVQVPPFEASKYMVTNRQMLQFVKAGGYENSKYWSKEGWEWRCYRRAKHPVFWVSKEGCKANCGDDLSSYSHCQDATDSNNVINGQTKINYQLRVMFDIISLPLDWPVEVNYHEAKAFCNWLGPEYRLPTEAEEHVLRALPNFDPKNIQTDPIFADDVVKQYNINLAYGSSTPVNLFPKSVSGCHDTMGNVWEWVEDHFNGIPGFKTNVFYDDYSTPSFDGKHTLVQGGSWISTGDYGSRFNRNTFRRHFIQHAGFRLAKTIQPDRETPVAVVDTPVFILDTKSLDFPEVIDTTGIQQVRRKSTNCQYLSDNPKDVAKLAKHEFFADEFKPGIMERFTRVRNLAWEAAQGSHSSRVLLVGCGCGRLAFDLSEVFDKVVACDVSGRCIHIAKELQENGKYEICEDDNIFDASCQSDTIFLPNSAKPNHVTFKQLTWIPFELKDFSIVINTLLDRAQNPRAWLLRMRELVTSSKTGRAIVVSKEWNAEKLHHDFEPFLQLVLEEELQFNEEDKVVLSMWKNAGNQ